MLMFTRGSGWLGLILIWVCAAPAFIAPVAAQQQAGCKGPAELERAVLEQPTPSAYNDLGAYFGQRKQFSCAISAFETALRLDAKSWKARYNLALALREKGELKRAASELHEAVAQNPTAVNVRSALGAVLSELGELDAAVQEYKKVLKLDSHSTDALLRLAQIFIDQKRYSAAIFRLRQAEALDPKNPSVGLALVVALTQSGNKNEAIQILEKLLTANPEFALGHISLGALYAQEGLYLEAAKEYGEALKLEPANDVARLSQAKALLSVRHYEAALPLIQPYTRRKPQDYEGHYLEGVANRGLRNYLEAEAKLRRAFELNPTADYRQHYELGVVLEHLGKLEEAKTHLEKAKELKPDSAEVRFYLSKVHRRLKDERRARQELQVFQRIKEQGQKAPRAVNVSNEAGELLEKGDAEGAAQLSKEAIKLSPNDPKLHYNLSLALNKLGDHTGEQKALERVIELDPNFALAHNRLGLLYLAEAKSAEAEREFQTAVRIEPQFAEAENNLGVLYGQQGKKREAEKLFRRAVENDPQYAEAFVNLGLVLAAQGRFGEAEKEIENALRITPNYSGALTALRTVQQQAGCKGPAELERAILEQPTSGAHNALGAYFGRRKQFACAISAFKAALRLDAKSWEAHYNLALALREKGELKRAASELHQAVAQEPTAVNVRIALGDGSQRAWRVGCRCRGI